MNLGEMRTEVRDRLGEDQQNFWMDRHINRRLYEAMMRFSHEQRWKWLLVRAQFDVAQDDETVELVDDVDFTRQFNFTLNPYTWDGAQWVAPTNDRGLIVMEKQMDAYLSRMRANAASLTGTPKWYAADRRVINTYTLPSADSDTARAIGMAIRIFPAADVQYLADFRFYRNPRTFEFQADDLNIDIDETVPDVPIQYHDAIVALACGNLWLKELNGGQKAQEQFNIYNSILDQARKDNAFNADDEVLVQGTVRAPGGAVLVEGDWVMMMTGNAPLTDPNYGEPDPFAAVP
jgi:hypothetical protein